MANPDILITPGQGTIGFSGTNTGTIQLRVAESGDIHFEGDQGSLLILSDGLSDSLFSVNDAAGMPVFEVFADDTIKAYRNNETKLEIDPDNNRVRVRDNLLISGNLTVSGDITSASATHEATSYTASTHVSGISGYFGKVGIGTSTWDGPNTTLLQVDGDIRLGDGDHRNIIGPTNATLGIYSNPNDSNEGIKFSTDGGTTIEMFLEDGGNVGIGPDLDPTSRLHVNSAGEAFTLRLSSTASRAGMVIDHPSSTDIMGSALVLASDNTYRLGTASYYHVSMTQAGGTELFGNGSPKMIINPDGEIIMSSAAGFDNSTSSLGAQLVISGDASITGELRVAGDARVASDVHVGTDIIHDSDPDTYVRFNTDRIRLFAGGVELIDGREAGADYVAIGGLSTVSSDVNFFVNSAGAGGTDYAFVVDAGLSAVGINVEPSDAKGSALVVSGDASITGELRTNGNLGVGAPNGGALLDPLHISAGNPRIRLEDTLDTNNYSRILADNGQLTLSADEGNNQASSAMIFKVDNGEVMRMNGANVGIGTTAPGTLLELYSSAPIFRIKDGGQYGANATPFIQFNDNNGTISKIGKLNDSNTVGFDIETVSGDIRLRATSSADPELRVTSSGVGIGTQFPAMPLHVNGSSAGDGILYSRGGTEYFRFDDTGTDLNIKAANALAIYTNGTSAINISTSQKVGIGTTNPAELLTVSGANATVRINTPTTAGSDTAAYTFGLNAAADLAGMRLDYTDRVASGLALFVQPAYGYPISLTPSPTKHIFLNVMDGGGVGIGTASPGSILHLKDPVIGAGGPTITFEDSSGGTQTATIKFDQAGQNTFTFATQYQSASSENKIQFAPADNIAMTVRGGTNTAGNGTVGIGTQTPTGTLHVYQSGDIRPAFLVEGSQGSLFSVEDTLTGSLMSVNDIAGLPVFEAFDDGTIVMGQYNSGDLVVTGNKVGIGTAAPGSKLTIRSAASWDGGIKLESYDGGIGRIIVDEDGMKMRTSVAGDNFYWRDSDNHTNMILLDNGNVGIGTTNPQGVKLHVNGSTIVSGTLYVKNDQIWEDANSTDIIAKLHDNNDDGIFDIYQNNSVVNRIHGNGDSYFKGGSVGIGSAAPKSTLHVDFTRAGEHISAGLSISNINGATNDFAPIYFGNHGGDRRKKAGIGLKRLGSYGRGSLHFAVDSNADDADVSFANDTKMVIDKDGQVGIGTTTPATIFHIHTDSSSSQEIFFDNDGVGPVGISFRTDFATDAGLANFIRFDAADDGGNNTRYSTIESFIVDNTNTEEDGRLTFSTMVAGTDTETMHIVGGNVGIGTDTPVNALHVHGSADGFGYIRITDGGLGATATDGARIGYNSSALRIQNFENSNIAFFTNNTTQALTIKNDGNVGIGTTNPSYKLDVTSSSNTTFRAATTGTDRAEVAILKNSGTAQQWTLSVAGTSNGYSVADKYFYIADTTGGTTPLVIDKSGNVGIGTKTPSRPLEIIGTSNASVIRVGDGDSDGTASVAYIEFGANNTSWNRQAYIGPASPSNSHLWIVNEENADILFYANNDQKMVIKNDGNVGIGTTVPSGRLHVENNSTGIIVANDQITGNAFEVFGAQGNLLTVTDDLSDSLFSVNDAAGMPIFEVFADDRIKSYRNNESKLEVDPDNNRIRLRDHTFVSGILTTTGAAVIAGGIRFTAGGTHELSTKLAVSECVGFGESDSALTYFRRYSAGIETFQMQPVHAGTNNGIISVAPYGGELHVGMGNGTATLGSLLAVDGDVGVSGDLSIAQKIIHGGDTDTFMQMLDDRMIFEVGGVQLIDAREAGTDYVAIGGLGDNGDVNFIVNSAVNGIDRVLEVDAGTSTVGINCDPLDAKGSALVVSGDASITGSLSIGNLLKVVEKIEHIGDTNTSIDFFSDYIRLQAGGHDMLHVDKGNNEIVLNENSASIDIRMESNSKTNMFFLDGSADRIGIGTTQPLADFEVHGIISGVKSYSQHARFEHRNNSHDDGGSSVIGYNTRPFNKTIVNNGGFATTGANTFTLNQGLYWVVAETTQCSAEGFLQLRNNSDSAFINHYRSSETLQSVNVKGSSTSSDYIPHRLQGVFYLGSSKTIELQSFLADSNAGDGLGQDIVGSDSDVGSTDYTDDVYAWIEFWKISPTG